MTGSTVENGSAGYVSELNKYTLKRGVITVSNRGEHSGTAFYQENEFIIGPNAICLDPNFTMNQYEALYICVLINNLEYGGYDNYPTKTGIVKDMLKIPVTSQGEPDWQYMENYMHEIEEEANHIIESLIIQTIQVSELTKAHYGFSQFKIGDLFNVKTRTYKKNNKFSKKRECDEKHTMLATSATVSNNMLKYWIKPEEHTLIRDCLTVASNGNAGFTTYQPDYFAISQDSYALKVKEKYGDISEHCYHFLATVMSKTLQRNYNFGNKAVYSKVKNEYILLPRLINGEPDWQYMEDYMREIEQQVSMNILNLEKALKSSRKERTV